MLRTLKEFKNNSVSNSYLATLLNPCFYSVALYRISNKFYRMKMSYVSKFIWLLNRIVFNVDIDYRAKIGKGFILVHGLGTVIGCDVKIGENVKIYHGVTLGGCGKKREYNGEFISQPQVGDNCIIYTNSCLFGPIIIKAGTKIKAGQIISKDIV